MTLTPDNRGSGDQPPEPADRTPPIPHPGQAQLFAAATFQEFSGPLPAPQFLEEYDRIVPGSAAQLVGVFVGQVDHRQGVERDIVNNSIALSRTGMRFGFIVAMAFLGVSAYLVATGHELAGTIIGSIDLVSLVTVFVLGQRSQGD